MVVLCPRCNLALDVGETAPGAQVRCRCTALVTVPTPPTAAGVLRCPGCGADASCAAPSCAYCRAMLATLLCARCFSPNFLGSHNCAKCGAVLPIEAERPGETGHRCPSCRKPLVRRLAGGMGVDYCEACAGVFIDRDTEASLFQSRPRPPPTQTRRREPPPPATIGERVRYRRCPGCGEIMNRKTFGRGSGVILDVCARHGTWFERDELRRCVEFVESGGLEEAQRRELEDLRTQAARAREERATLAGIPWGDDVPPRNFLAEALFDASAAIARWIAR
ncbi:MAG: zf-TFIIB domain-containing protein [Myxococcota bacterium]|mgnify:CR=1 FL=1